MEHDAQSSRRYKENWEDEVQAGKADRAEIAELKEAYALLFKESGARRDEIDRLRDALAGLFGLVQLVLSRDDLTEGLRDVLYTNHRVMEAQRVLNVSLAGCKPLPKVFGPKALSVNYFYNFGRSLPDRFLI